MGVRATGRLAGSALSKVAVSGGALGAGPPGAGPIAARHCARPGERAARLVQGEGKRNVLHPNVQGRTCSALDGA